ncbi:hypothetical protein FGG12_06175 [Cupriavidus campinensis]|uniref:Uncharacterized protein n=2 Tax=Cupriavidus campinensis TaxID=151783 RepID=A0ABY3ET06_9BURK|nr:hypothetical protein FGG12_06175 [Cupriavidus campinensis]
MKRPCANCPWRKEGAIELRPGRIEEIVADLMKDDTKTFWCHKTLDKRGHESACMGALAYQAAQGRLPVAARFALIVGDLKRSDLEKSQLLVNLEGVTRT